MDFDKMTDDEIEAWLLGFAVAIKGAISTLFISDETDPSISTEAKAWKDAFTPGLRRQLASMNRSERNFRISKHGADVFSSCLIHAMEE